jgi:hypothetical protein
MHAARKMPVTTCQAVSKRWDTARAPHLSQFDERGRGKSQVCSSWWGGAVYPPLSRKKLCAVLNSFVAARLA